MRSARCEVLGAMVLAVVATGCARTPPPLVPIPAVVERPGGDGFTISAKTAITLSSNDPAVQRVARQVSEWIRRGTGVTPPLTTAANAESTIEFVLDPQQTGGEAYDLQISPRNVTLKASAPAGFFYGAQTLRQLLPYWSDYEAVVYREPRPAILPALHVRDSPRYQWRGAMLDVARHFFTVEEVERFIDTVAMLKLNYLHLHLSDDQGWRIEIRKRPDLAIKGSSGEVGGTPGGFYTQAQYAEIVAYAADRFITIVPEIEMPGHSNAALSTDAALTCDGKAPPPFTGIDVGFSTFCVEKETTYTFLDDVIGEIAAMTPGAYLHVGGDEVKTLSAAQYKQFLERVQTIVQKHGKRMIGWDEIAVTSLLPSSVVQHWRLDAAKADLARAPHLILSPADRTYLDMKYDADTALGLNWAALIPVKASYDWDPGTRVPGAASNAVLGVEAPLWSETVANIREAEFLAMPRLAAIAEVAWSPQPSRDWDRFKVRLGAQGPRWSALGINFYRAPDIPWK